MIDELNPNYGASWIKKEVVILWSQGDTLPALKTIAGDCEGGLCSQLKILLSLWDAVEEVKIDHLHR